MDNPSYKIIRVARDQDLIEQIGRDIYFDVVDHDRVRTFHVGELKEISKKAEEKELKLFLEVELGLHRRPVAPPVKSTEDILLFFKLYDPEKGELRYVGRLFVNSYAKPYDILGKVNEMAGFGPNEEVDLYEEIKFVPFVMCELIDRAASFRTNQLEDGDIICFQKRFVGAAESCRYLTVPSFLEHIRGLQDNSEYELLKLQSDLLSSAMKKNRETHLSYKELSEKLAREKEELKKKLEETKSRNAKLISDWEALMAESKETKSKYISQKPKLAEAEERKRIAEERIFSTPLFAVYDRFCTGMGGEREKRSPLSSPRVRGLPDRLLCCTGLAFKPAVQTTTGPIS
ncbi:hypothetical protein CRG98_036729 [Punica granatum]|uniref:Ubiquitin carboxyl-terminal hydrolase 7 ICP0-binding domain-containing protein n=1 Tax=Punica granatum TaxID=22663 RepID=A0A2I0IFZ5_PUNGR|nr:hypothetical protein CRG98_036729 [Punica granatum]